MINLKRVMRVSSVRAHAGNHGAEQRSGSGGVGREWRQDRRRPGAGFARSARAFRVQLGLRLASSSPWCWCGRGKWEWRGAR